MSEEKTPGSFRNIEDCGCSDGSCGESGMSRRDFLRATSAASAAAFMGVGSSCCGAETPAASGGVRTSSHLIPANKNLPPGWLRSLKEKGMPVWWSGEELFSIGMPVGGIGTGQIYLCGDGTLGEWEIFNQHKFIGHGPKNYARRGIAKPVTHGMAILFEREGKQSACMLDQKGFADVRFRGEYPIGTVEYADETLPVRAKLEAFSPFIPLNAKDSALPCTLMFVTVENTGKTVQKISMISWLENPIARQAGEKGWYGVRHTEVKRVAGRTRIAHSAVEIEERSEPQSERPAVVYASFESASYGDWKIEGAAFGSGPVAGTLPFQNTVTGFEGARLVNSFHGKDATKGLLRSPAFTITHKFINFLVGGGGSTDLVGIRLVVDGNVVRVATGANTEQLKWDNWSVSEYEGKQAVLEIFDETELPWGHTLVDQIEFADRARSVENYKKLELFPDYGSLTWDCLHDCLDAKDAQQLVQSLPESVRSTLRWDEQSDFSLLERRITALACKPVELEPGAKHTFGFVLSWHFPNSLKPDREAGHEYAARFADAAAVGDYVQKNLDRLTSDTRKWRDTWYDSSLPVWLLDRVMIPTACLATGTVQWWKSGRFWAWEGVACCEGTCTHVWNYAHSLARLFPELERIVREQQDLGAGLQPDGLVGFRGNNAYAADGQCGTVLKVWREHLTSTDSAFLKKNWSRVQSVLNYLLKQDENSDGLIEGRQHNTFDIDFYGANTFVGSLYLGALRAGEEMAREMGDESYANRLRKVYESGRKLSEEKLWNGEYFVQQVDLAKHREHQYGPGCLSDQVFGQNWAHQTGLGAIYDPQKSRKALESVWKYNWAPDCSVYNAKFPPERPYTDAGEAGLFICTWPGSHHLDNGVRYRDEVWTGIEYQVASHMIYEGLIEEGLAMCRAVHDRYHPMKRNPFNEVECSDYYARAMASWGMLLALSGFEYHGPKGVLGFAPRFGGGNFRSSFTAAEGWGTFEQKTGASGLSYTVHLRHGKLRIAELSLPAEGLKDSVRVTAGGAEIAVQSERKGEQLRFILKSPIILEVEQKLEVGNA